MSNRWLLSLLLACLLALPAAATAEEQQHHGVGDWLSAVFHDYDRGTNRLSNYQSPPLIPIGASLGARNGRFMFGTEVSVVLAGTKGQWAGGYIDGLYGAGQYCFSLGPEVGFWVLGVDGGYMGCAADGPFVNRWVGRVFLSLGAVSAYLRKGTHDYWDAGVLLKIPWGVTLSGLRF
jgi:hypothetical protein